MIDEEYEESTPSESEQEVTEKTQLLRDQLVEQYEELYLKISGLNQMNLNLESRINQFFKKKLSDNSEVMNKIYTEDEEDPIQKLNHLFALYKHIKEQNRRDIAEKTEALSKSKTISDELKVKVENMNKQFAKKVYEKVESVKFSNLPKASLFKNLEAIFAADRHNNQMIGNMRIKNLRLMKRISDLKNKDSSSLQINKMELERIKIQNHAYNSRIEKRSDETSRLLKKLESNLNVITHINEASNQYERKISAVEEKIRLLDFDINRLKEDHLEVRKEKEKIRKNQEDSKCKHGLQSKPELVHFYNQMIDQNKELNMERAKKINQIKKLDTKAYKIQDELIRQCELESVKSLL